MLIAEAATTTVELDSFITALTSSITPAQVLAILSSVIGVGMAFFLMWFGVRKATKIFTTALTKGKIRA